MTGRRMCLLLVLLWGVDRPSLCAGAENTAPSVEIKEPRFGASFSPAERIVLKGSAYDLEDKELKGQALTWRLDSGEKIGTGESCETKLPVGTHYISLDAVDSGGMVSTARLLLRVVEPAPASAPAAATRSAEGDGQASSFRKAPAATAPSAAVAKTQPGRAPDKKPSTRLVPGAVEQLMKEGKGVVEETQSPSTEKRQRRPGEPRRVLDLQETLRKGIPSLGYRNEALEILLEFAEAELAESEAEAVEIIERVFRRYDLRLPAHVIFNLLTHAVEKNRGEVVGIYLDHVGPIVPLEGAETSPLHLAIALGYEDIAVRLAEAKAYIMTKDLRGETPLHLSVGRGYTTLAAKLLGLGVDVNATSNTGQTPLHVAVMVKDQVSVNLLLSKGPKLDIPDKDDRSTPLHDACLLGAVDIVAALLDAGADPKFRNAQGKTAMIIAAGQWRNTVEIIELLHKAGGKANTADDQGVTALHRAAGYGLLDAAKKLLEFGADINSQAADGTTALHWATLAWSGDAAALLIKAGAKVSLTDRLGKAPLHHAAQRGNLAAVKALVESKAAINARDLNGSTPLGLAMLKQGNEEVIAYLRAHGAREE